MPKNNKKMKGAGNCSGSISGTTTIPSNFNADSTNTPPLSVPIPSSGYPTYASDYGSRISASHLMAQPINPNAFNHYPVVANLEVVNV
jgi:hypothetical protein